MQQRRAATTTAGILYITGTVAGVVSVVVVAPVRDAGDPLAAAAQHSGAVVTGALLVLVMGLTLALVPVVLFPVLRRAGEVLAIGQADVGAVLALVFCLGAVLFYLLLYRSRIVPRWIAAWGLAALPFYVAAYLLAMYGVIDASSTELNVMVIPLAVQEIVLAVWMIARGFNQERPLPATGSGG